MGQDSPETGRTDEFVPPCNDCGGTQVINVRHDVDDPNTGYYFACIPCLVRQRNTAQAALGFIERHVDHELACWRKARKPATPDKADQEVTDG